MIRYGTVLLWMLCSAPAHSGDLSSAVEAWLKKTKVEQKEFPRSNHALTRTEADRAAKSFGTFTGAWKAIARLKYLTKNLLRSMARRCVSSTGCSVIVRKVDEACIYPCMAVVGHPRT